MQKIKDRLPGLFIFLLCLRSVNGTDTCACTAVDALIGIYHVLAVTLGNCFNGATFRAGTARNAIVVNFVCHLLHLPFDLLSYILADFFKITSAFLIFFYKFFKTLHLNCKMACNFPIFPI